ncbi:hypothetical protein G3I77_39245 [Streptomyces sp. D2-8]|uniref:hypothetical protein n=1 Tax=Streptomyces sp. D2-8 TaxID=2707767 RepID=UPI0020BEE376|nr:hypothetical protein [Streptomyces sp. D2-8]MCK8438808.1 hypothetical protein [Streptomyces sp. D2-8]
MSLFIAHRRTAMCGMALLAGMTLLATASPAAIADDAAPSTRAAATVEAVTGTADIAASSSSTSAPATATMLVEGKEVKITAPSTATGRVTAEAAGSRISMKLPGSAGTPGLKTEGGTIVYPGAAPSTDLAVQPTTDGGVRALVTLKDSAAATERRFPLSLPDGAALQEDGFGGYLISETTGDDPKIIGSIDAPWATDAKGRSVPTHYRVEGDTLVQTVETSADTAFPVVADPKVSLGWYIYLRFSKSEVKDLAKATMPTFAVVAAAMACGKIPNPAASAGCAAATGLQAASLWSQAKDAAKAKQCVEWKVTYVGVIKDWKRYKC